MIFERGRNRKKFFLQPKPSVRIEDPSSHFLHSFATDRRSHTTSGGFDIVGEQYELKMYISEAYVFQGVHYGVLEAFENSKIQNGEY